MIDYVNTETKALIKLYLQVQSELKRRGVSLKDRKLKEHLSITSHNVKSPLTGLAQVKAKAINRFTRSTIGNKVRD